jgi:hypothetical protein
MSVVSVMCCQVEVSASNWSLVQNSPTDCGASLCVIKKPLEWGGPGPRWAAAPRKKGLSLFRLHPNLRLKLGLLKRNTVKMLEVTNFAGHMQPATCNYVPHFLYLDAWGSMFRWNSGIHPLCSSVSFLYRPRPIMISTPKRSSNIKYSIRFSECISFRFRISGVYVEQAAIINTGVQNKQTKDP